MIQCVEFILKLYIYVYITEKTGEHCDIQIAIYYEMKLKKNISFLFLLNLFNVYISRVCVYHLPINAYGCSSVIQ